MIRVIYQGDDGVAILDPNTGFGLSATDIGKKDVPVGVPFWVMDISAFMDSPVESWEIDTTVAPSGIGGTYDQD
ncbi:hypothetical protein [Pectobacterium wasabiae]|uniref:Phage tail protein n=1 Tax=Pectobacterium wasabiae TaxID=55208 RepID=A0AAW3ENU7_9GAMM|nr:hypothetical protein [Pectobacterium wasabiae]AOR65100.1 hypothetical protein A7983_17910 [Pectobacterium wasabiae CFBP 3304]EJS96529.1 Hypothetical protein Y17_0407 [Pectobacterium wasabiae CFBP 3304]KFX09636.1 hypothetical protein JV38_01560 [Pectobacterium wasabiae]KGA29838.1 hypothetical protein KU73_05285 [Pectobacterium wasabiae]